MISITKDLNRFSINIGEEKEVNQKYPSRVYQLTVKLSKLEWQRLVNFSIYGLLVLIMYTLGQRMLGLEIMAFAFLVGIVVFCSFLFFMFFPFWGSTEETVKTNGRKAFLLLYILNSLAEYSFFDIGYAAFLVVAWISFVFCSFLWFDDNSFIKEELISLTKR